MGDSWSKVWRRGGSRGRCQVEAAPGALTEPAPCTCHSNRT
eukprot:CAMPEP_0198207214 /NCGR_PEP_ID=MMETSP1445-20131203/10692_1 /TAXON_ID=36898 /ORGANISM="Pyramimonas sp., Strain CCMP2087" /LENGTH=40 /DNA_ID= /DNA_START= /DNA_END= /DNA_ORIENTATION=